MKIILFYYFFICHNLINTTNDVYLFLFSVVLYQLLKDIIYHKTIKDLFKKNKIINL